MGYAGIANNLTQQNTYSSDGADIIGDDGYDGHAEGNVEKTVGMMTMRLIRFQGW